MFLRRKYVFKYSEQYCLNQIDIFFQGLYNSIWIKIEENRALVRSIVNFIFCWPFLCLPLENIRLNTIKYLSNSINTNPIKFNGFWSVNRYMVYKNCITLLNSIIIHIMFFWVRYRNNILDYVFINKYHGYKLNAQSPCYL